MTQADRIYVEAVAAYCQLRDGQSALRAKVGVFLDQHRDLWGITSSDLGQFGPLGPRAEMFVFDTFPRKQTHYVEDWNLVVPVKVVERIGNWSTDAATMAPMEGPQRTQAPNRPDTRRHRPPLAAQPTPPAAPGRDAVTNHLPQHPVLAGTDHPRQELTHHPQQADGRGRR